MRFRKVTAQTAPPRWSRLSSTTPACYDFTIHFHPPPLVIVPMPEMSKFPAASKQRQRLRRQDLVGVDLRLFDEASGFVVQKVDAAYLTARRVEKSHLRGLLPLIVMSAQRHGSRRGIGSIGALDAPRTVSVRAVGRQFNVMRRILTAGSKIFVTLQSRVSLHRRIRRCVSILSQRDCSASATQNSRHHGTPACSCHPIAGSRTHPATPAYKASAFKPAHMHVPRRPQRSRPAMPPVLPVGTRLSMPTGHSHASRLSLLMMRSIWAPAVQPSRPGELHPEPLTEPDVNLSTYPARATA